METRNINFGVLIPYAPLFELGGLKINKKAT